MGSCARRVDAQCYRRRPAGPLLATCTGLAALAGYTLFEHFPAAIVAATTATAAGAILGMLVDAMIPEAFEVAHDYAGFITVAGFLLSLMLSKLGG